MRFRVFDVVFKGDAQSTDLAWDGIHIQIEVDVEELQNAAA